MGEQRGKDDGPPRLEDLAGRLHGTVLDLGWAAWTAARELADVSLRACRAAADVLLDSRMPRPGDRGAERPPVGSSATGAGTARSERESPVATPGKTDATRRTPGPASSPFPVPTSRPEEAGPDPFLPPLPAPEDRDRLVAVERDPETLFAWWDVSAESRDRARAEIERDGEPGGEEPGLVLRVAFDGAPPRELALPAFATGGYVERAGEDVGVEIELGLSRGGRFARLAGPFSVAARPVGPRDARPTWRRVGSLAPGAAPADDVPPAPSPSPEQSEALAELSSGLPADGSSAWPGGRKRGPRTGHGGASSPPSS
ncbi:MAG: hypothetical protein ACKO2K_04575 [Alphaproteobacteria bacterium]